MSDSTANNEKWRSWPREAKLRYLRGLRQLRPLQVLEAERAAASQQTKRVQWCTTTPTTRQSEFLNLDCLEAFYGGAAGPGKSQALLMAALQYVDQPKYSAIILRKDFRRLSLASGLIPRSHEWLSGTSARWDGSNKTWHFPSGATLSFGYLETPTDKYRYGSSEYQFIGWDELTEFDEDSYRFLFSRLRKTTDNPVPLRMRAASNPGGVGHHWVKNRFVTEEAMQALRDGRGGLFWNEGRAFVPGRLEDNPFIDRESYIANLMHLDPLTRERLLKGDWSVNEEGRIKATWLRYWEPHGDFARLLDANGRQLTVIHRGEGVRFQMVDGAGSADDIAKEKRGKPHSHSVIGTFEWLGNNLLWTKNRRGRWEVPDLCQRIGAAAVEDEVAFTGVEDQGIGLAICQYAARDRRINLRRLKPAGKDKLTRAAALLNMMEEGRVYFLKGAPWLSDLEAELLTWTGHPDEPADQVDVASYAAMYGREAGRPKVAVVGMMGRV